MAFSKKKKKKKKKERKKENEKKRKEMLKPFTLQSNYDAFGGSCAYLHEIFRLTLTNVDSDCLLRS